MMKTQAGHLQLVLRCLLANVVVVNAAPPSIEYQPQSQTVVLYQQAAFGVIAEGTAPLYYQWRKNGVLIAGATNDQIILAQPRFSDAGLYSVVVSNAEGDVTSVDARLTVDPPRAGDLDCSFVCGGSINGRGVFSIAIQPNGKILIAGSFSIVSGALRSGIARLNADGTTDYTFMHGLPGANREVVAVAVQSDGKLLIGGAFTTVHGVTHNRIARLNADGSLDDAFQAQAFPADIDEDPAVQSVALQSDGKILIGGTFTRVNSMSRRYIARLNPDGTLDTAFEIAFSFDGWVNSIAVQRDGKVLIGGNFITVNGVSRNRIARLNEDGSLDDTFQNGLAGAKYQVHSIAVQNDGKILIGGDFTSVNDVSRNCIARLNEDGSLDSSFLDGLSGVNGYVESVAVQSDGKVLIGGSFTNVNGVSRNGIARLNVDGTLDGSFQIELSRPLVRALVVQNDDKILVGGNFIASNDAGHTHIVRVGSNGIIDSAFRNGFPGVVGDNAIVYGLDMQGDGKWLIAGDFTARLDQNGVRDSGFLDGLSGPNNIVYSVAVQNDSKILIGGIFTTVNGISRNRIARLNADGSLDGTFLNGLSGVSGSVLSLNVQRDGKILIGGGFTNVNGMRRYHIARLNSDGSLDSGFLDRLSGVSHTVSAVAVQNDGKILIGGNFTSVNDVSRNRIARLNEDGSLDIGFLDGLSGVDEGSAHVSSLLVQRDGKIPIGGSFSRVNGVKRNQIARMNPDGTLDGDFLNGLAGANSALTSMAIQSDGKILVAGYFSTFNGVSRNGVARLHADGTLDTSFQNAQVGGYVASVAINTDGKVLIGGNFIRVGGVPARAIARLWGSADVPPLISIDRSGREVNVMWDALPNRSYRVQYNGELSGNNWIDLPGDVSTPPNGVATKTDTALDAAQRLYRVKLLP